jgi:hypothetical protein
LSLSWFLVEEVKEKGRAWRPGDCGLYLDSVFERIGDA